MTNAAPTTQLVANLCVGVGAFINLVPLQVFLFEAAGKRNDHGQGVLVGALLLLPMWLLLLTALLCVVAVGGFDTLPFGRPWLYILATAASLSMLALSFMVFEFPNHPSFLTRFIGRVPIYLFPLATMLMVVFSLNPHLASGLPIAPIRMTWLACAGISLLLGGGFFSQRLLRPVAGSIAAFGSRFSHRGPSDRELVARIASLDPDRDFEELLGRARYFESRSVRETATARLRTHPNFIDRLAAILNSRSFDPALGFLVSASLTPEEQVRLAQPTHTALQRHIDDIPAPNFMMPDRRKQLLSWGRKHIPLIIGKFTSTTSVDFSGVMPAFEHALRPDDTRRR